VVLPNEAGAKWIKKNLASEGLDGAVAQAGKKASIHQGPHPNYDKQVLRSIKEKMEEIMEVYAKSLGDDVAKQQAIASIRVSQQQLKKELLDGTIKLSKHGTLESFQAQASLYIIGGIAMKNSPFEKYDRQFGAYTSEYAAWGEKLQAKLQWSMDVDDRWSQFTLTDEQSMGDKWYAHTLDVFNGPGLFGSLVNMGTQMTFIQPEIQDLVNLEPVAPTFPTLHDVRMAESSFYRMGWEVERRRQRLQIPQSCLAPAPIQKLKAPSLSAFGERSSRTPLKAISPTLGMPKDVQAYLNSLNIK